MTFRPPPQLFDAQLHSEGLSEADLATLRDFGLATAVLASEGSPHPTSKGLLAHFDEVLKVRLPRFEQAGIRAFAALGVHPQGLPRRGLLEVVSELPGFIRGGKVVAVGETGFFRGGELEAEGFAVQVELAKQLHLPVIVHTPREAKELQTRQALRRLRQWGIPPDQVLINHVNARTVRLVLECGHFAALTVHPDELSAEQVVGLVRRLGPERLLLDSGHGGGEMLGLARVAARLELAGLSSKVVARVARENAAGFFGIVR